MKSASGIVSQKGPILRTKVFFWIGKITAGLASTTREIFKGKSTRRPPLLVIEAGIIGWTSLFYSELYDSARDYLAPGRVIISTIDRSKNYSKQSLKFLLQERPTHFCFDPRTGSQKFLPAIFQTMALTFLISFLQISPIVILTDASVRLWRYQVFLLTAKSGIIVTFLDPKEMGNLIPHERIIGPMFMPISISTLNKLQPKAFSILESQDFESFIHFVGSLYPLRRQFLLEVNHYLSHLSSNREIVIDEKSEKISNHDYWTKLKSFKAVVTTTRQNTNPDYTQDRLDINQMVFRISESLAAGQLVFAEKVPGMEKYFIAGEDFVECNDSEDAATKIIHYFKNQSEAYKIAIKGHSKYAGFINDLVFWKTIDSVLHSKLFIKEQ